MIDFMDLLQISFFCGCVSSGLGILRDTRMKIIPYIFFMGFSAAFVFNGLNSAVDTFIAGLAGGLTAAVLVGIFHRKGIHSYIFIVIPVIYCIGPGGALYKLFLYIFDMQFDVRITQLIFIVKDALGIWLGIILGTKLMNAITKHESEKFNIKY